MQKFESLQKNNGQFTLYEVAQQFGIRQSRSEFLPGRFYSLMIEPEVSEINEQIAPQINDGKPYVDLNPIGLALFHENWKETAIILDLKIMPSPVSAKLLEGYWAFAQLNGMSDLFIENKLISLNARRLIDHRFYLVPPTILNQIVGASNLYYAINKYNMEQIKEAKLIDWDQFGMLVQPKVDVRGIFPQPANLAAIFEQFLTNSFE